MDAAVMQKIRALGGEGILNEKDVAELNEAEQSVLMLMSDGQWHEPSEIKFAAGMFKREASEGLRRLRSLRKFFDVEKQRASIGHRHFHYRLKFRVAIPSPASVNG